MGSRVNPARASGDEASMAWGSKSWHLQVSHAFSLDSSTSIAAPFRCASRLGASNIATREPDVIISSVSLHCPPH